MHLRCLRLCSPDRRRWPWQKRQTTRTPPGGWCSEHCNRGRPQNQKRADDEYTDQRWSGSTRLCKRLNSHDQMLARRLFSFLLDLTLSLVAYAPDPGRHHQDKGVQAGHACMRGQKHHFHYQYWWTEPCRASCIIRHSTVFNSTSPHTVFHIK